MTTFLSTRPEQPAATHEDASWVAAPPFRAWLRQLASDSGLGWLVLARAAGVSSATVHGLLRGVGGRPARQLRRGDAAALLALDRHRLQHLAAEPGEAAELRTLAWQLGLQGCSVEQIGSCTGLDIRSVRQLMSGGTIWCSRLQILRAEAACEAFGIDPGAVPAPMDQQRAS